MQWMLSKPPNAEPLRESEMSKRKPSGFVATCQCGVVVGAMDYERTERKDAGKILGEWLSLGCTVAPRFEGTWSASVSTCRCSERCPECGEIHYGKYGPCPYSAPETPAVYESHLYERHADSCAMMNGSSRCTCGGGTSI